MNTQEQPAASASLFRKRHPKTLSPWVWGGCMLLAGSLLCLADLVRIPAEPFEPNPARGYQILLNTPLEAPLLTETEYADLWKVWPEALRNQAEKSTAGERRKMMLSRYGFQNTKDRPGDIPQQFTPDRKGNLVMNCLACHGGSVEGRVVPGLGNSLVDLRTLIYDIAALRKANGEPPARLPEGLKYDPPEAEIRGMNNAWGIAISFMLLRDKDLNLMTTPQFPQPTADQLDLAMDTPAYWLAKKKTRFYCDGFIEKTHRDIMQFTFGFTRTREQILAQENDFRDIYAWINSVPAPAYTREIDRNLAAHGEEIYTQNCAGCHGSFGEKPFYPERTFAVEKVGTDPVRLRDWPTAFATHLANSWVGDFGRTKLYTGPQGYVAPPLDGIWATAPYLHNGSVPTLWHLLTPDKRPKIWNRSEHGYDHKLVGLEITEVDRVPEGAQANLYYRTDVRGAGNAGHNYPEKGLSENDKLALLEYLKSL